MGYGAKVVLQNAKPPTSNRSFAPQWRVPDRRQTQPEGTIGYEPRSVYECSFAPLYRRLKAQIEFIEAADSNTCMARKNGLGFTQGVGMLCDDILG